MNEKLIQDVIYRHWRSIYPVALIVPNVYVYAWESDLIFVTTAGYVHEYEIKVSRSDFKADASKEHRHRRIVDGRGPAFFWYVCPEGMIKPNEVPEHAGLVHIREGENQRGEPVMFMVTAKDAPRHRKSVKLAPRTWISLAKKGWGRYWTGRIKTA